MLLGLYFTIVIALPMALGTYVVFNGLPRTTRCPSCAGETVALRSRPHRWAGAVLRCDLQRRWCMACAWEGSARLDPVAGDRRGRFGTGGSSAVAAARRPRRDRVDLRSVEVDGHRWRVMVECWAEGGRWRARLVFEDTAGQVCEDEGALEGGSVLDVISRAYSLPERALAGRLRRSIR